MMGAMQAAEVLGITRQAVTAACKAGRLFGAYKAGGQWKIPAASLDTMTRN